MAKKKRGEAHSGGHGWYVSFADLMGLMMSFFVMLVAFSNQDQQKLKIVAGSMREAFGVQTEARHTGIIETDGLPTRPKLKKHRAHSARGSIQYAHPGSTGTKPYVRRPPQSRSRIRTRLGIVAAGITGHAGTDRNLETHHV